MHHARLAVRPTRPGGLWQAPCCGQERRTAGAQQRSCRLARRAPDAVQTQQLLQQAVKVVRPHVRVSRRRLRARVVVRAQTWRKSAPRATPHAPQHTSAAQLARCRPPQVGRRAPYGAAGGHMQALPAHPSGLAREHASRGKRARAACRRPQRHETYPFERGSGLSAGAVLQRMQQEENKLAVAAKRRALRKATSTCRQRCVTRVHAHRRIGRSGL